MIGDTLGPLLGEGGYRVVKDQPDSSGEVFKIEKEPGFDWLAQPEKRTELQRTAVVEFYLIRILASLYPDFFLKVSAIGLTDNGLAWERQKKTAFPSDYQLDLHELAQQEHREGLDDLDFERLERLIRFHKVRLEKTGAYAFFRSIQDRYGVFLDLNPVNFVISDTDVKYLDKIRVVPDNLKLNNIAEEIENRSISDEQKELLKSYLERVIKLLKIVAPAEEIAY